MRRFFLSLVLTACPFLGLAAPADGRAAAGPAPGRNGQAEVVPSEQSKDQRRAALRQALVPQQEATPAGADTAPGRQLSPTERAELRRLLRDQSSR